MKAMMKPAMPAGHDKYEIESAARTIVEAEKIRSDPKMSKLVAVELKKQMAALQRALPGTTRGGKQ